MIGQHVKTPAHLWPMFEHMIDLCPFQFETKPEQFNRPEYAGMGFYWNGDYSRLKEWVPHLIRWHKEGHPVFLLAPMGDNQEMRDLFDYGIEFFIPSRRIFPEVRSVNLIVLTGGKAR